LDFDSASYDGTSKTPSLTVKDGEIILTENVDYTVSYTYGEDLEAKDFSNAEFIEAGNYKLVITGIGNYAGSTAETVFAINDKKDDNNNNDNKDNNNSDNNGDSKDNNNSDNKNNNNSSTNNNNGTTTTGNNSNSTTTKNNNTSTVAGTSSGTTTSGSKATTNQTLLLLHLQKPEIIQISCFGSHYLLFPASLLLV
jgi:cobalamin biosynthesis protein CobT